MGKLDNFRKNANNVISYQFIENFVATCLFIGNSIRKLNAKLIFAKNNTYLNSIQYNSRLILSSSFWMYNIYAYIFGKIHEKC